MYVGDISFGLVTHYNNSVVDTDFLPNIYKVKLISKKKTR